VGLDKLHFPAPLRYSEDIDLVRTTAGRDLFDLGHALVVFGGPLRQTDLARTLNDETLKADTLARGLLWRRG